MHPAYFKQCILATLKFLELPKIDYNPNKTKETWETHGYLIWLLSPYG